MGVIPSVKDLQTLRTRLDEKNADEQYFDFKKINESYGETLKAINSQLEDYKSPLFKYLQNCRNSERTCHGYFQPTNPFHQQIFCDREIYQATVQTFIDARTTKFDKCAQEAFDKIEFSELQIHPEIKYTKSCFSKVEIDGIYYLKNKTSSLIKEIRSAYGWFTKFKNTTIKTIKKSLIPEGTKFILEKTIEEFNDVSLLQSKIKDLNEYYNTVELSNEFQHCCDGKDLYNQEQRTSVFYLKSTGQYIEENTIKPNTLTFKTEDVLSSLVFSEADRQFWRDQMRKQSPLELSSEEKYSYFKYLEKDPFFYDNMTNQFSHFVTDAKKHKRSDYYYRLAKEEEFDAYMDAYQKKMGFAQPKYINTPARTVDFQGKKLRLPAVGQYAPMPPVDLSNERQVIGSYLFNGGFKQSYLYDLSQDNNDIQKKKFDALKEKTYYPQIFKGFLPYQFARTAQAEILRELQKMSKENADAYVLNDIVTFHRWADQLSCQHNAYDTYCRPIKEPFRRKKHDQLYEKIISGRVTLEFASKGMIRKYIYNSTYVNGLNKKIKDINKLCWEYANPKAFEKDRKPFAAPLKTLNEKMEDFYTTPRFEEILGHSDFADTFGYKPSEYAQKCFTKGYLFGNSGYPNAVGWQILQPSGAGTAGVPVYNPFGLRDYPIQQVYNPSIFQIKKSEIEDIEDDIADKIAEEYRTLRKAYFYKDYGDYKEFLEESAKIRIFALIDYAVDHPSMQVGQYICNMIEESDISDYEKAKFRETLTTVAMSAAIVMSIFTLPVGGLLIAVFDASTTLIATGVAVGVAAYEIQYYRKKNDLADIAYITGNKQPKDAMNEHEQNDERISSAETAIMVDLGLFIVVGLRPVLKTGKIVQKMLDKEYNLVRKTRQMEIEELVGQSAGQIEKTSLNTRVEDFIYDYKKVTEQQFAGYKNAIIDGTGDDYLRANFQQIEKYVPVSTTLKISAEDYKLYKIAQATGKGDDFIRKNFPQFSQTKTLPHIVEQKTWREAWNEVLNKIANNAAINPAYTWVDGKYSYFIKPSWLKLKPYINQYLLNPFYTDLKNEARIVSFLNRAKELEKKIGKPVFTKEEVEAFASRMKHYVLDDSGNFYKITEKELLEALDRLMLSNVTGNPYAIRAWLEPLVKGELLNADEWSLVLKTFKGTIHDIDDCKDFLKTIKFAKREYAGMRAQIENARELANVREFRRPSVYGIRTKKILEDVNDFYDIAKYTRNKTDIRTVRALDGFIKNSGKTVEEVEQGIRKFDHDFELQSKIDNLDNIIDEVNAFEARRGDILTKIEGEDALIAKMDNWKDPLKYEKQFLQQEKKYNEIFIKKLSKFAKKEKDISLAYGRALIKTQLEKKAAYECSLPSSAVRLASDRNYQKLAKQIALGTNFMGYMANHGDEQKTPEWMGRFFYDMTIGYVGGNIQSKIFTTRGGGPLYKTFYDLLSGDIISGIDALIFNQINNRNWNNQSKYQRQFARLIYESEDTGQVIQQFFKDHPDVEAKIMDNFENVKKEFDRAELNNSKGNIVTNDLEQRFIKAGLIDDVVYNDMLVKDRELGKSYIYHDLIESGYLDDELYQTAPRDEDLQDQLYALLAEINYEDLYNHKTGQIKYPGVDPFNLGDLDAIEIHSGNEGLDRFLFYAGYDAAKTVVAYPKNNLVYKILCNGRFLPGNTSRNLALAVHIIYKMGMDPLKYYLREQATGH